MEFRVKALDREQAVLAQHVDAIDETDARRQLGLLGLRVISMTPVRQARLFARPGKIPLVIFSQELVSLLDAGLSLVEAIEALTEKEASPANLSSCPKASNTCRSPIRKSTSLCSNPKPL